MNTKTLSAKAGIQIQKPIEIVFEAIVDPNKMMNYFIESSTGRITTNEITEWKFPEFDDISSIIGKTIQPYEYISFDWSDGVDGMLVEIFLEKLSPYSTVVRIKEGTFEPNEQGIKHVIGQTEGWANFLACLKAYLEYGINLRKGAFDFMNQ